MGVRTASVALARDAKGAWHRNKIKVKLQFNLLNYHLTFYFLLLLVRLKKAVSRPEVGESRGETSIYS